MSKKSFNTASKPIESYEYFVSNTSSTAITGDIYDLIESSGIDEKSIEFTPKGIIITFSNISDLEYFTSYMDEVSYISVEYIEFEKDTPDYIIKAIKADIDHLIGAEGMEFLVKSKTNLKQKNITLHADSMESMDHILALLSIANEAKRIDTSQFYGFNQPNTPPPLAM